MADTIRHARAVSPWFIPNKGGVARDLHGITNIGDSSNVSSTDVFVVGKQEKCGTDKGIPVATLPVTQQERGEINSYLTLANLVSMPSGGFELSDFSSALVDAVLYEKDAFNGNLVQSIWLPKTSINSFGITIADPEARIERTFELGGDNKHELNGDNRYLIHVEDTGATAGAYVINVSDPTPVVDPRPSALPLTYILRIDRTRAGVTETIELTTDYTYTSGTQDITILAAMVGDVYNVYYSSDSFGTAGDPTSVDTASPCFLKADSVTVLISDGVTELELELLTSLSIDVTINRLDEGVIGKEEKILKEISDTPVTVSLNGRIQDSTILKAFQAQLADTDVITDINEYLDNVRVTVKVYSDASKATFLIGYQVDGLSFTDDSQSFVANEFGTLTINASSDNLLISNVEGDLT
jgi:hypothetical protein